VNTFLIIFVLLMGFLSLLRSRHMRKGIPFDKSIPERKAVAEHRIDRACEQTTALLKKVTR
jgi:hypothetical protein